MGLDELQDSAAAFLFFAGEFCKENSISDLFTGPIDHFAIKTANTAHYEHALEQLLPFCQEGTYIEMHGRRLATLKLCRPLHWGKLGQTNLLELMEPRPEKAGVRIEGFEHIELYNPDFASIRARLNAQHVRFQDYENPNHKAVVVPIGEGMEIKFTDGHLSAIVEHELKDGTAKYLR